MRYRLSQVGRDLVRDNCADNPLLLFLETPCLSVGEAMPAVRLTPEEVFLECISLLDFVKAHPERAEKHCQNLWKSTLADLRNLSGTLPKDEESMAVGAVIYAICCCLMQLEGVEYKALYHILLSSMVKNCPARLDVIGHFMSEMGREVQSMGAFVREYMEGSESLSAKLDVLLKPYGQHKGQVRVVMKDELGHYFKAAFKGIGNGNHDFYSTLVKKLEQERTSKEFAVIANMIYRSSVMTNKPATFKGWHKTFCELVGCEYVEYRPAQLEPTEKQKSDFYML